MRASQLRPLVLAHQTSSALIPSHHPGAHQEPRVIAFAGKQAAAVTKSGGPARRGCIHRAMLKERIRSSPMVGVRLQLATLG